MKDKYSRKYLSALKNIPTLEYNDLSITTKNGGLKKVHPLDVKYEGSTFGTIRDMYFEEIEQHSELKSIVKQSIFALTSTLIEKGYNTTSTELNTLIEDISKLLIIEPTKQYYNFKVNSDGYVVGKDDIHIVTSSHIEIPDDFNKGYWKIIDGKFVLDEDKYKQLWGAL